MTFVDHAPDRREGRYGALLLFLALTLGVGAISGYATMHDVTTWYAGLSKPNFNPPNWVFGPVWTLLYAMIGVAAWREWRIAGAGSRPMLLFYIQLALNFVWSFIFFRFHQIGAALTEVVVLLVVAFLTAMSFAKRDRIATFLFVPYVCWLAFATWLNAAVWELNT